MVTYAEKHIQFISNLNGTTLLDIALVSMQLPLSTLVVPTLLPLLWPALFSSKGRLSEKITARLTAILEFSVVVVPLIGSVTLLANHTVHLCAFLATVASLSALACALRRTPVSLTSAMRSAAISTPRLPCVSNARAQMYLMTAVSILAVDYRIFPRRLAKAETFGAGLMDMAVGCFAASHGITAPESRTQSGPHRPLAARLADYWRSAHSALVLAALGAGRLALVKLTGYHEHVSEYGVHCNFFFILAAVKVLAPLCFLVVPTSLSGVMAVLMTFLQQGMLDAGAQQWIIYGGPRKGSLIEANREALVSLPGYIALYFLGVALGIHLRRPRKGWLRWLGFCASLFFVGAGLWRLATGMDATSYRISRRLVNATYIVACGAQIIGFGAVYLLVDIVITLLQALEVTPPGLALRVPRLMAAANDHGLALFGLANLATGAVNMATRTIEASDVTALAVLTLYMAGLMAVMVWISTRHLTEKPKSLKGK